MRSYRVLLTGVVLVLLAGPALAQSEEEARARELIARIKKEMKKIDEMLLQADRGQAGEAAERMEQVAEDVQKLLNEVAEGQRQVIDDIEELARMTKYSKSNQSQSSDSDPQQQQDGKNREREREPDPKDLQYQGEPEPQPQGEEQPQDGRPDESEPEQSDQQRQPPPSETDHFEREDTTGRWGNLPPKVAEMLQNLGPDQFPAKYKKLIEEYYRKSAEEKQQP